MPGVHKDAPGIFLSSTKLVVPGAAHHDCASFITALLVRFPGLTSLSLDLGQPHGGGNAAAPKERRTVRRAARSVAAVALAALRRHH